GTALLLALYLPFVHQGRLPLGPLGAYLAERRFNGPLFAALRPLASPTTLAALAVLTGLLVAIWARARLTVDSAAAWAWPVAPPPTPRHHPGSLGEGGGHNKAGGAARCETKWVAEATPIRRQGARDAAGISGTGCAWTPPPPTHTTGD